MVMSEKEKLNTAYHEAGHAIVGYLVPEHDPVYKVTIIPRGRALGVTMYLPEEDRYSMSQQRLESSISSLFGGRIAEEMINGMDGVTTGASNDIERATEIARNMVTKWGLSDRLGPLTYSEDDGEVFLGRSVTQHKQVSDDTAHAIDEEVRSIIDSTTSVRRPCSKSNVDKLHAMAKALVKYETIGDDQIKDIMEGREPRPPEDWDDSIDPTVPMTGPRQRSRSDRPDRWTSQRALVSLREHVEPGPLSPGARGDGHSQCHARFIFGWRPVRQPRYRAAPGATMASGGAAIIDIGGESTRPGRGACRSRRSWTGSFRSSRPSGRTDVPISIDTSKADVMREAVAAGASMINDVYALRGEGALQAAAELQVPVCLMHMQGEPRTMQESRI